MHSEYHASLDLDIFIHHTAEALSLTKRFIGEEPYCPVTSVYNKCIKKILPPAGIEAVEIPRIKTAKDNSKRIKSTITVKRNK